NVYGMTETTAPVLGVPLGSRAPVDPRTQALSVGVPMGGTRVAVLDDDGNPVPPGQLGEIAVRGPQIVPGYWRNEQATNDAIRDGWLRTGDVGYVDEDGRVLEAGTFRFLAIANPDLAPYGAAARDVLVARGLWNDLQSRIVRGQDIGQAYQFVATGNAELGFVAWAQLARQEPKIPGSYWLVPDSLHEPIAQEAVLLKDTPGVRAFAAFVQGPEAREIIRSHGYGP
ncbi:MAG: molybdate ABC transporter substrate-binding protein, partial [Gammaproteobacteria bacterium]